MPVARLFTLPGVKFPDSRRPNMLKVDVSDFQTELAKIAGRNGLLNMVDASDLKSTGIVDRMSGELWAVAGGSGPAATTINSKAALQFTQGVTGRLTSANPRQAGSFTVVTVWSQTSGEAAVFPAQMVAVGAETGSLIAARQDGGAMKLFAPGASGNQVVSSGHAAGTFVTGFAYDADTHTGAVLDNDGSVIATNANFAASGSMPTGAWNLGGWLAGYDWTGKMALSLIFDRSLAIAANQGIAGELFAAVRGEYGV